MKTPLSPRLLVVAVLVSLALLGLRVQRRDGDTDDPPQPTGGGSQFSQLPGRASQLTGGGSQLTGGGSQLTGGGSQSSQLPGRVFQWHGNATAKPPAPRHPLQPPYPHPYRFLLNQPHKCRHQSPFLVLLVATEPADVAGRHAIRQTWGNESSVPGFTVLRLFLLGLHPRFGAELRPVLEEESQLFGDILQQDFLDTYNNLTLKTLMGMEWVTKHCPNATYVMKADRDVFLNLDYLARQFLVPPKRDFMTGYVYRNTGPLRHKSYKWYVPPEVYPNATYPPYCGGPAYVLSADLAVKIYAVAQTLPVINMEDSFMGICLHALGVGVTASPWGVFNMYRVAFEPCRFARLVMVHHYPPHELLQLWPRFQEAKGTCHR